MFNQPALLTSVCSESDRLFVVYFELIVTFIIYLAVFFKSHTSFSDVDVCFLFQ